MTNIYLALVFLVFLSCQNNHQTKEAIEKTVNQNKVFKIKTLDGYPFVTEGTRNGIRAMEGVDFSINKADTSTLNYRFSIVNWRDKFEDLKGIVKLDSSTLLNDAFFIDYNNGKKIAAYKFYDNTKTAPIWIGVAKKEAVARIFRKEKDGLKELSSLMYEK
jgi:hypothetical protein